MHLKKHLRYIRAAYLSSAIIIILAARIHPLSQPGYKKFCEITNRVQITYFTNINAVISILLFSFGVIVTIGPGVFKLGSTSQTFLQISYMRLVSDLLSMNLSMAVVYWYLFFRRRDLLGEEPKGLKYFRPNIMLSRLDHALPPILNLLESFFVSGNFRMSSLVTALTINVLYYTLIVVIHYYKKVWPYRFFNHRSYLLVFIMLVGCLMIGIISSYLFLSIFQKIRKYMKNQNQEHIFMKP